MKVTWGVVGVVSCAAVLGGCGIGYDKLVMVTQSNVGVNAETTPVPTAQVSVSRTEAVIEPTYANGDTPPVLAGFSTKTKSILNLFAPSIGSVFSVGDASLVIADLAGDQTPDNATFYSNTSKYDSSVTVPIAENELSTRWWQRMGRVRPLFFSTDTATGVKVSWTGTGGQYPDRLNVGYKRKEWALAPLTRQAVRNDDGSILTYADKSQVHKIKSPSLIASVAVDVDAASSDETFSQVQFFATGKAATMLARQQQVRRSVFEVIAPAKVNQLFGTPPTTTGNVINDWIQSDPTPPTRSLAVKGWLLDKPGELTSRDLVYLDTPEAEKIRIDFINEFDVVPPPPSVADPDRDRLNRAYAGAVTDVQFNTLEAIAGCVFEDQGPADADLFELSEGVEPFNEEERRAVRRILDLYEANPTQTNLDCDALLNPPPAEDTVLVEPAPIVGETEEAEAEAVIDLPDELGQD